MQPPTQRAGPPPQEPGPKISRHQATDPCQPIPVAQRVPSELGHRRGAASWAQRHRFRANRIFRELELDTPGYRTDSLSWTDAEQRAWEAAAAHLRSLGLFGSWQVPPTVPQTWRHRHCCWACGRDAA